MENLTELEKTHQLTRNSQLVDLDNIGHLPHIEDFYRFIKPLMDFLNKE